MRESGCELGAGEQSGGRDCVQVAGRPEQSG